MSLSQKQQKFAHMVALLILQAEQFGYAVTLGDAYRDDRVKYGHGNSLHRKRLAIDVNLFLDGKYLQASDDHKKLGEYWESIGGFWGGRFGDGNHYSLDHDGMR